MATLATPADVRAIAGEFSALTDPQIQYFLDMADLEIDPDMWGSRARVAETYLAAHKLATSGVLASASSGGSSGAGPVQSVSVGEVSVSYGAVGSLAVQIQGLDPSLASSKYGLEYARLVKLLAIGVYVDNWADDP